MFTTFFVNSINNCHDDDDDDDGDDGDGYFQLKQPFQMPIT